MVERALILAAGVGARLGAGAGGLPKALLSFDGKSLVRRHLEILSSCGIREVVFAVGYKSNLLVEEIATVDVASAVEIVENPHYTEGSVVTLWCLREFLIAGGPVLVMDADVLYDRRIIERLIASDHPICMLLDRDLEPGNEPVKICVSDGQIVDFRKVVDTPHDFHGESVGFFKISPDGARDLAAAVSAYVETGRVDQPYEEAIRDVVLSSAPATVGFEDITGLPWIEIDFADDVKRAETRILPLLRGGGTN